MGADARFPWSRWGASGERSSNPDRREAGYERLSRLDRRVFALEDHRGSPAHLIAVHEVDAGPLRLPDGSLEMPALRALLSGAVASLPAARRRLAQVPTLPPVWIDGAALDLDRHLQHGALPRPADDEALCGAIARMAGQPLERGRPLWEAFILEGLDEDRLALISKCHLSLAALGEPCELALARTPDSRPARGMSTPGTTPSGFEILLGEAARRTRITLRALIEPSAATQELEDAAIELQLRARMLADQLFASRRAETARAPLGARNGSRRHATSFELELPALARAADALGGSIVDIALTALCQALRRSLLRRSRELSQAPIRALTCDPADPDPSTSTLTVELPIDEASPRRALKQISRQTRWQMRGPSAQAGLARGTAATRLAAVARELYAQEGAEFDLSILFGAASEEELELLDAPLRRLSLFPPLLGNAALSIAVVSYGDALSWSFVADAEAIPNLDALAADIAFASESLCKLALLVSSAEAYEAGLVHAPAPPPRRRGLA